MTSVRIRELLEAGVHFGHQTKRWNPKMKQFLFGSRSGIYLIDLEKTEQCLQTACDFLEDVAAKGQLILFIGTKKQAKGIIEAEAQRTGMLYVVNRWLGGALTNFTTIKRNIDLLRDLRKKKEEGFFERLSKKDAKRLSRQLERLEEHFSGLANMDRLPGCLFVVDTKREENAVKEANRLNIPVVAICDTNADPDLIAYPIPGNDDAIRSVKLIVSIAAERIMAGRQRFLLGQQQPIATATPEEAIADQQDDHDTASAVEVPDNGSQPSNE